MSPLFKRLKSNYLSDFINKKEEHKNILILSGARQVGKTTLVQEILKGHSNLSINLEKTPLVAEQIDRCDEFKDFENYLRDAHKYIPGQQILFIDEAQSSLKLGSFVRFMKEDWLHATVILSGSLVSELHHHNASRRPVGRESYLELWPLTFKEFLMAMGQDSLVECMGSYAFGDKISEAQHVRFLDYFDQYIKTGGLPDVVMNYINGGDYRTLRAHIYKTYEDDFVRYFSLEDINLFKRCLQAVAANTGSPSKDSQVIRPDAPGYKKVAGIFSRLEKWNLIIKCEQLGTEPEKNKYHPKRYLYDIGILADLRLRGLQTLGVQDLSHPVLRTPLGGMIENTLALSLKNQFADDFFGIRISQQSEIDFAVKHGDVVYPIECKMSVGFKRNYLTSVKGYLDRFSTRGFGLLFYGGAPMTDKVENCHILPYYLVDELARLLIR